MKIKVINADSEVQNLNVVADKAYHLTTPDDLLDAFGFADIVTIDDLDEIMQIVAEKATHQGFNNYDKVEEFWDNDVQQLERIDKNSNLYQWLRAWYGRDNADVDKAMAENITGFYETDAAIYYTHAIGFAVIGADLLGEPHGDFIQNDFYKFINA